MARLCVNAMVELWAISKEREGVLPAALLDSGEGVLEFGLVPPASLK